MTLEEIKTKLQEILDKLSSEEDLSEDEIKELEDEADKLEEEKKSLIARAEKRSNTLQKIKNGMIGNTIENSEERKENKSGFTRN